MRQKRKIMQRSKGQGYPLLEHINAYHPLVELAVMIDWTAIDRVTGEPFEPKPGGPRIRPRLIAGLLYLQHAFDLSDEQVVAGWVENPYWQVFTRETYLQTEPPIDPSSLSRWRTRLGEVGMEELLAQSIEAAKRASVIKPSSARRVIVDTTVMEKAIAYPTDSALLERSREHLVKAAWQCSLKLRLNYNRQAPQLVRRIGQYAHAAVQAHATSAAHAAYAGRSHPSGDYAPTRSSAASVSTAAGAIAWRNKAHPHAAPERQEKTLCVACAGS